MVAVGEVVDCNDIEASVEQCHTDMRANVAGAASHQNHVEAFRIRPASIGVARPNCLAWIGTGLAWNASFAGRQATIAAFTSPSPKAERNRPEGLLLEVGHPRR
jgi:hypothetical protein